jgi:hypothetical protein
MEHLRPARLCILPAAERGKAMAAITIPIPVEPTVVNIDERKEVEYRCKEWGCTEAELMDAVAAVGVDAPKVEAHLINAGHKRKAPLSLDSNR